MPKINRNTILTYINTTPAATNATWKLLGEGIVTGTINLNPKTTEETYIHETTASFSVDSYAPTIPIEMTAIDDDDAFEYLDAMRIARSTLADAETEIVNVWNYQTGGPTAAPAEKQTVCIQFDTFGGDGGTPVKMNFTINYVGDRTAGTFNTTTPAFT
jgi:hypothetical protein